MNYSEAVKQTLRKTFPKHLAYNCLIMSILGNYNIQFCNSHSNSHPVTISLKIICFQQRLMCSKGRIHLKISLWGLLSGFLFFFMLHLYLRLMMQSAFIVTICIHNCNNRWRVHCILWNVSLVCLLASLFHLEK